MRKAKENKEKNREKKEKKWKLYGLWGRQNTQRVKKLQKTETGIFNYKKKKSLISEITEKPEGEESLLLERLARGTCGWKNSLRGGLKVFRMNGCKWQIPPLVGVC